MMDLWLNQAYTVEFSEDNKVVLLAWINNVAFVPSGPLEPSVLSIIPLCKTQEQFVWPFGSKSWSCLFWNLGHCLCKIEK